VSTKKPRTWRIQRFPNGIPVSVLRPSNPELAVKLAKEALGPSPHATLRNIEALTGENKNAFDSITEQCGPYNFVGYLGLSDTESAVLNEDAEKIGDILPGDSFCELLQ